jgi:hypothetical protein
MGYSLALPIERSAMLLMRGAAIILDSSRSDAPRVMRERISKSKEIDWSPASILPPRDWLGMVEADFSAAGR